MKNNWVTSQAQAKRNNMSISLKKLIFEAEAPTPPQKGAVPSAPKPASKPPTPPTPPPQPAPAADSEKQSSGEGDSNSYNVKFDIFSYLFCILF